MGKNRVHPRKCYHSSNKPDILGYCWCYLFWIFFKIDWYWYLRRDRNDGEHRGETTSSKEHCPEIDQGCCSNVPDWVVQAFPGERPWTSTFSLFTSVFPSVVLQWLTNKRLFCSFKAFGQSSERSTCRGAGSARCDAQSLISACIMWFF